MSKYDWLEKKLLRSVDQLRLWSDNPRLDPEERHNNLNDYVTDLISDNAEKESFLKLIDSISQNGLIPADPIVVWKNSENEKYYVAEGNRRVLALKLLLNPEKAPRSIRSLIRKKSELVNRDRIEKVRVSVAPTIEDCEWYINQRHATSTLQRPWSRLQQQRWIAGLYDKYGGDVEKVSSITNLNKGQLEYTIRILNIRDLALDINVQKHLSKEEIELVKSHRIPMTILERWFLNPQVKEEWGIEFDGTEVKIKSDTNSFYRAYATWLKYVFKRGEPGVDPRIDTRTITTNLPELLGKLPRVNFIDSITEQPEVNDRSGINSSDYENNDQSASTVGGSNEDTDSPSGGPPKRPLHNNLNRNQLVVESASLSTLNHKLDALFREFKKLPIQKYQNTTAASLRVFLDLAIAEYINSEGDDVKLQAQYKKAFHDIALKQRLEFIKQNKLKARSPSYKVVEKLLNSANEYSLDTLNNYIHGKDQHNTNKPFLNGFWDFLFPLFQEVIGMSDR